MVRRLLIGRLLGKQILVEIASRAFLPAHQLLVHEPPRRMRLFISIAVLLFATLTCLVRAHNIHVEPRKKGKLSTFPYRGGECLQVLTIV
jgi:hypothetical protein